MGDQLEIPTLQPRLTIKEEMEADSHQELSVFSEHVPIFSSYMESGIFFLQKLKQHSYHIQLCRYGV